MTNTAVAADFHQTFDVQLGFTAQIAFNFNLVNFLTEDVYKRQVLGTPPAFILSQDQTLHLSEFVSSLFYLHYPLE